LNVIIIDAHDAGIAAGTREAAGPAQVSRLDRSEFRVITHCAEDQEIGFGSAIGQYGSLVTIV
jgi:hypothetical protein